MVDLADDVHNGGILQQHALIKEMDTALAALIQDMEKRKMLDKVLMIWDYASYADRVKISLTYTLDGRMLLAERTFTLEFISGINNEAFTKLIRTELSTELMAQANEIANKYLETQGE